MTRVTQLIHDAGKYLLISVYPLPTHPTHNFTHNNGVGVGVGVGVGGGGGWGWGGGGCVCVCVCGGGGGGGGGGVAGSGWCMTVLFPEVTFYIQQRMGYYYNPTHFVNFNIRTV